MKKLTFKEFINEEKSKLKIPTYTEFLFIKIIFMIN